MGFIPVLLPVALSPGASFTLAMNSALAGGRGGLLRTLAGTALGIYTHALLIGLGVTAILVSSPALFNVLKYAGAAYLMWLGVQLIRSGLKTSEMTLRADGPTVTLKEAWLANVLNPKAIVFLSHRGVTICRQPRRCQPLSAAGHRACAGDGRMADCVEQHAGLLGEKSQSGTAQKRGKCGGRRAVTHLLRPFTAALNVELLFKMRRGKADFGRVQSGLAALLARRFPV